MSAHFVATRVFGDATVSLISEGTVVVSLADLLGVSQAEVHRAVPGASAAGLVQLAFTVGHVRLGNTSVLIDGGIGSPPRRTDLEAELTPGLVAGLAAIGVQPDDVTHVVFTHAHWDHVDGGLVDRDERRAPRFPNARYVVGRADLEVGRAGTHPHNLCTPDLEILESVGVLDLVDGDYDVAPGITYLDAPGETPGHHCVLVESRGTSFMHVGDLYHHPVELLHGWVQVGSEADRVIPSRQRVLAEALRRGTTVASSHGLLPGWTRVTRRTDGLFEIVPDIR
jgi:glyoxylase-like metal-dependent hydrolase (beta-lactamase superfamily II)